MWLGVNRANLIGDIEKKDTSKEGAEATPKLALFNRLIINDSY